MDKKTIVEAMRDMDLCFMSTAAKGGGVSSRPMSNNSQVEWDGSNWFFSNGDCLRLCCTNRLMAGVPLLPDRPIPRRS